MAERHRVIIIGGGFGGLSVAQSLAGCNVDITLMDRRNFHLFQPLLYQVATGGLSPANIAAPLRSVLKRQSNCRVLHGDVTAIDTAARTVTMHENTYAYDTLVIAAGATNNYFGRPEWEQHAPGLKTIEEATVIRRRVLTAFEEAERLSGLGLRSRLMTFVVVGGGPTGVEMAGAISELARHTLRRDFRSLDPSTARIVLIEGGPRLLPPFPESLSAKAERSLQRMGVEVWTSSRVKDITQDHVLVERGGTDHRIDTETVVWAAGVKASPLGRMVTDQVDRGGRVLVQGDLTVPGHPEIFVIGDLAAVTSGGKPVPGVAPAAIQMGRYVGARIRSRVAGVHATDMFKYWDKGSMATIGRNSAVAFAGPIKMSGWLAWAGWLFIHIIYLIHFSNRTMVLFQWFWNYWTRNRAARLITGEQREQRTP